MRGQALDATTSPCPLGKDIKTRVSVAQANPGRSSEHVKGDTARGRKCDLSGKLRDC